MQGGGVAYAVATAVTSGSAQTVSLSASRLPAGATATFAPSTVTAGAGSTLTVSVGGTTAAGTYPISIVGTGTKMMSFGKWRRAATLALRSFAG